MDPHHQTRRTSVPHDILTSVSARTGVACALRVNPYGMSSYAVPHTAFLSATRPTLSPPDQHCEPETGDSSCGPASVTICPANETAGTGYEIAPMKIYALTTAVASIVSLVGSLIANLDAHESLLLIALTALFVQWHAQRKRQMRTKDQRARLATMRSLAEEAALLGCSQVATCHPELRCELHIFERTVVRCLADLHHGRTGAPALSAIRRCVTVIAPALLAAVQMYDDKVTLQSVCRQFRQMSQRLLPRIRDDASSTDAQLAFNGELSNQREPALVSR
jgi:hypothetical protein